MSISFSILLHFGEENGFESGLGLSCCMKILLVNYLVCFYSNMVNGSQRKPECDKCGHLWLTWSKFSILDV